MNNLLTKICRIGAIIIGSALLNNTVIAQTNVALTATSTHSSGGVSTSGYGPELYNDNNIPAHLAAGTYLWGWINAGGWIEYNWTSPQTFDSITFHNGGAATSRHFSTLVVEYWNGTAFVNVGTVTGTTTATVGFKSTTPITTNRLRFNNIQGGSSSPAFREIQCWAPNSKDVGIAQIISPIGIFCPGPHNVKAIIKNYSNVVTTNVPVQWSINGVAQNPITYTGSLQANNTIGDSDTIDLGPVNFAIGTNYTIKVWTNETSDITRSNDTSQNIVSPATFTLTKQDDTLCPGGATALTLSPNFGYSSSIIQWQTSTNGTNFTNISTSPGFNLATGPLNTTTYYRAHILSGAGCYSNIEEVNVLNTFINVDLGPDTSLCAPNSLTLDAQNPGLSYLWNDNSTAQTLTALTPGTYYVTVTNSLGCSASDTITFEWNAQPSGSFNANNWGGINMATFTMSARMENTTRFYWNFGDGSPQSTDNPVNHTYPATGDYTIELHLFNDCNDEIILTKKVKSYLSVNDIIINNTIDIYPNPTNSILNITTKNNEKIEMVIIVDAIGKTIKTETVNATSYQMNISELPTGMYSLIIKAQNGTVIEKVNKI